MAVGVCPSSVDDMYALSEETIFPRSFILWVSQLSSIHFLLNSNYQLLTKKQVKS